ncbi:hypothetical protein SCLCIDRAFT_1218145 [Scleroderma citrinum Foug A]|uniref:Uncharacterized protein n=1 Tax=Scleroderma citrinum Foug A TaxID=1036808 RepID=A0A0C3DSI2_9AGAM|nr:hypothetical protein SCLCIDRAFT_1218145 [Scleroderma citrinum Foug A]
MGGIEVEGKPYTIRGSLFLCVPENDVKYDDEGQILVRPLDRDDGEDGEFEGESEQVDEHWTAWKMHGKHCCHRRLQPPVSEVGTVILMYLYSG